MYVLTVLPLPIGGVSVLLLFVFVLVVAAI